MLHDILAKSKPRQNLAEHTDLVVENWVQLRKRYYEYLPDEEFWRYSFLAVLFHDFGKVCENFQDNIQPDRKIEKENLIRHEFLSGMLLYLGHQKYYSKKTLSLFAVFTHHKSFTDELFDRIHIDLRIQQKYIDEFLEYARTKYSLYNSDFSFTIGGKHTRHFISNKMYGKLYLIYQDGILALTKELKPEDRRIYIFYKALLNIADWTASGGRQLEGNLTFNKNILEQKIIEKLKEDKKYDEEKGFNYKKFQLKSLISGNVLAVAPTGSGKTEASLLWASLKNDYDNIFYLLPTRVTSNAIYQRFRKYFLDKQIALVHSSAYFFRKEIDDKYEEKEYAFIDRAFFKNITIGTIDQLLTQGFNMGFWEVKTFHQLRAKVIIDEIHLYEPYTLGLILSSIQYLQENFDTSFYIMTATMPKKLKVLLGRYLKNTTEIADKQLLNESRNIYTVKEKYFKEMISEIELALKDNSKKVLLVLNTVDAAIDAYDYFKTHCFKDKEDKVLCYHSRFMQMDRNAKEKKIFDLEKKKEGCLLIATQVVEVSLDIDFDILFTENAPIDAIIQRAGRINRKRKPIKGKVVIFKHDAITEEWIYTIPDILKNTFRILKKNQNKPLTEQELLDLVNVVYENFDIEKEAEFTKGLERYQEIQKEYHYIKDFNKQEEVFTRLGLDTISVIPKVNSCDAEDKKEIYFTKAFFDKKPMEKMKYELTVRKSKKYKNPIKEGEDNFNYIDAKYSFETGLIFNKKKDNPTPHTLNF